MKRLSARMLNAFTKLRLPLLAAIVVALPVCASAQISFSSTVDLALRNSPKVRSAQAQLDRAKSERAEARDVYIPSVSVGSGLGEAIGYSPYPPTLFTISAGSLLFNFAQHDYIRSADSGVMAAQHGLQDAREAVAEDAALTFVALDHDQQREQVLIEQMSYSRHLVEIVQQRFDAGYDSQTDLLTAKRDAALLHLNLIHTQGELANDRHHLASLLGLPAATLRADGGFPDQSFPQMESLGIEDRHAPAIAAAFDTAKAKQEQAFGDNRILYRPQVSLVVQYNHYASFTDSYIQLRNLYSNLSVSNQVYGISITIPLFDKARADRARETAADAVRAFNDAKNTQMQIFDAQARLRQSVTELQARSEVATLDQQLSQAQLEVVRQQMKAAIGNGPAVTPKEEQNALIGEREKYLVLVDTNFQMRQAEVSILRQSGRLEDWVGSLSSGSPSPLPLAPVPETVKP